MYMTYYKRPELAILDDVECQQFKQRFGKELWDYSRMEGLHYYKNGEKPEYHEGDEWRLLRITFQTDDDIKNGVYADEIKNVYYISKTFRGALDKIKPKLLPLICQDGVLKSVSENCCIIDGDNTYMFRVLPDGYTRLFTIFRGCFTSASDFIVTDNGIKDVDTASCIKLDDTDFSDSANEQVRQMGAEHVDFARIYTVYLYLIFKKYGDVEIETVSAQKTLRRSKILGDKVNNFMGIDVQVLDSRWFTTICRDEGFMVSGHFRLQPCKDEQGEWTRKLIYINPYAKHGYHRKAKIETINNKE